MLSTLMVSQTIFYIVSSVAIIALSILLFLTIYQVFRIVKNTRDVSDDLTKTYTRTKKRIKKVMSSFEA